MQPLDRYEPDADTADACLVNINLELRRLQWEHAKADSAYMKLKNQHASEVDIERAEFTLRLVERDKEEQRQRLIRTRARTIKGVCYKLRLAFDRYELQFPDHYEIVTAEMVETALNDLLAIIERRDERQRRQYIAKQKATNPAWGQVKRDDNEPPVG